MGINMAGRMINLQGFPVDLEFIPMLKRLAKAEQRNLESFGHFWSTTTMIRMMVGDHNRLNLKRQALPSFKEMIEMGGITDRARVNNHSLALANQVTICPRPGHR